MKAVNASKQSEFSRRSQRIVDVLLLSMGLLVAACVAQPRAAVTLTVTRAPTSPVDATVYIDEEFVGPLGFVAARGVRLPEGEHRITVQREGYFPWDQLVTSDRKPIHLEVKLRKIPD